MGMFSDCGCGCGGAKQEKKFKISLLAALVFFLVANPKTYILVRRILGSRIATPNGNPTSLGLVVHSLVFLLITWGLMNIKSEGFEPAPSKAPAPAPAPAPAEDEEEEEEEEEDEEGDDEEEMQPGPAAKGPAPSTEEDDDEEDEPAPANDDKADEPSAKRKAEKRIEDAWLYHAVDTGLRFGSFDRDMEIAGPAPKKNAPMQCGCPDGSSVTVRRK